MYHQHGSFQAMPLSTAKVSALSSHLYAWWIYETSLRLFIVSLSSISFANWMSILIFSDDCIGLCLHAQNRKSFNRRQRGRRYWDTNFKLKLLTVISNSSSLLKDTVLRQLSHCFEYTNFLGNFFRIIALKLHQLPVECQLKTIESHPRR